MWDGQKVRNTKVLKEVQCSCSPECQHIGGKRRKWQENMGEMKAEKNKHGADPRRHSKTSESFNL